MVIGTTHRISPGKTSTKLILLSSTHWALTFARVSVLIIVTVWSAHSCIVIRSYLKKERDVLFPSIWSFLSQYTSLSRTALEIVPRRKKWNKMKSTMPTKITPLYLAKQYWLSQSSKALQHNWGILCDRPLAVLDALQLKKRI